jgi:hypothetical protein
MWLEKPSGRRYKYVPGDKYVVKLPPRKDPGKPKPGKPKPGKKKSGK